MFVVKETVFSLSEMLNHCRLEITEDIANNIFARDVPSSGFVTDRYRFEFRSDHTKYSIDQAAIRLSLAYKINIVFFQTINRDWTPSPRTAKHVSNIFLASC